MEQQNKYNTQLPYNMQSPIEYIKRSLTGSRPQDPKRTNIPPNDLYFIRCLSNTFYLREQLRSYKLSLGDRVRVIGGELTPHAPMSYLWMFKSNKEDTYEIVHFRTDLSLACSQYCCHLQFGSLSGNQKFRVQTVRREFNSKEQVITIIRIKDENDNYLGLDGILQANDYAERNLSQQFALIQAKQKDLESIKGAGPIWTRNQQQYALDLTNASRLNENDIILYEVNHRMNQLWVFQRIKEGELRASLTGRNIPIYHIRSALTEQFVTYSKEIQRLVQSSYPEEWRIRQITPQQSLFSIEHVKLNMYLSYDPDEYTLKMSKKECHWNIPQWKTVLVQYSFRQI